MPGKRVQIDAEVWSALRLRPRRASRKAGRSGDPLPVCSGPS